MSESVTIDDIYNLFRASQEEFDRRLAVQEQKEAEAKVERDRTMAELKRTVERISRAVDSLYAYRQGLFVIKPAGNTVKIVNSDNFQPKIW
jgi:hypothetical protein